MDLESAIQEESLTPACASKLDLSLMPTEFPDDGTIDELLRLAGVSIERSAARRWLESALMAARGIPEPRRVPQPSPAKHNAPLDEIARASNQLIAALKQLRSHPHAYASFWRFAAFGTVYVNEFERAGVIPTLTNICDAAREARISRTGRPRNYRKQHIVDLALAFCSRFSPKRPSSDANNFFPAFAERFFELATGSSVEGKGHGIGRQVKVALKRLPAEMERAALLNQTQLK
ncbi:MAG: hypothetical protein WD852_06015 [Methyloceanibacter sp.]